MGSENVHLVVDDKQLSTINVLQTLIAEQYIGERNIPLRHFLSMGYIPFTRSPRNPCLIMKTPGLLSMDMLSPGRIMMGRFLPRSMILSVASYPLSGLSPARPIPK